VKIAHKPKKKEKTAADLPDSVLKKRAGRRLMKTTRGVVVE